MEVTSTQAGEAPQVHRDHDGENTTVLPSCASQSGVLAWQPLPQATFAVHSLRENFSNEAVEKNFKKQQQSLLCQPAL